MVTPRKVGVGLKRRQELNRERLGWRLAWQGSTEMKEASYLLGLKRRHQYSDERSNRIRAPCLTSFTNRIFHFSRPPGFRMAFDAVERNGRFGRIQCQRSKESSSRGKRKRRIFLCRRTVRVKVKSHSN